MSSRFAAAILSFALMAGTATAQTAGTYDSLSAGNRMLVDALFVSQQPPAGTDALTLDGIAALKGDSGWGNVFKTLKAEGYYPNARNFGDVVSAYRHELNDNRRDALRAETAERKAEHSQARLDRVHRPDRPYRPERVERVDRPERPERNR